MITDTVLLIVDKFPRKQQVIFNWNYVQMFFITLVNVFNILFSEYPSNMI